MHKGLRSAVLCAAVVVSMWGSTSAASAHPLVNLHSYTSFNTYLDALTKQYWTDGSNAHDQWELDEQNAQYEADIAAAKIYFGIE
ncbi:hypothetical protein MH117_07455 [Paenibacillus sp. ACRRX]|uniref:hypothetical protein n=1 Tax=unclassified Paenibacillus TaxID=185978 RepID=UPI001EF6EB44|nr:MULTISPECIES: hypothetical protein [unclassified Paenibacillus]MCG7407251.1 hypothetical protein [Paenibacillus sp. ACRRX]MDK8180470.1 hypothetical protein [Paenibacillus sp. UMB4589-SE434]